MAEQAAHSEVHNKVFFLFSDTFLKVNNNEKSRGKQMPILNEARILQAVKPNHPINVLFKCPILYCDAKIYHTNYEVGKKWLEHHMDTNHQSEKNVGRALQHL